MRQLGIVLTVCLLSLGVRSAQANLVIDIKPVTGKLVQGKTTDANVYIYSDNPNGDDTLSTFDYYFQVGLSVPPAPTTGVGHVLFINQATYNDLFATGNYVFQVGGMNNSSYYDPGDLTLGETFVGEVTNPAISYPGSTYDSTGGDNATNFPDGYVTVPYYNPISHVGTEKLLTILTFTSVGDNFPPSGTFYVSLVANDPGTGYSSFFTDAVNQYAPFSSNTATLTIVGPTAVPEPSTFTLGVLGALGVAGYLRRRRKA